MDPNGNLFYMKKYIKVNGRFRIWKNWSLPKRDRKVNQEMRGKDRGDSILKEEEIEREGGGGY